MVDAKLASDLARTQPKVCQVDHLRLAGVGDLSHRPFLESVRAGGQCRFHRRDILAIERAGLFEVQFEARPLVGFIVGRPAQGNDGIE